uniref:Uncharacterized protein n=1 Tax=Arundo donax TaxID=35708 RepID=A0A0A9FTS1_ARUDO
MPAERNSYGRLEHSAALGRRRPWRFAVEPDGVARRRSVQRDSERE